MIYRDRVDAGRRLATMLERLRGEPGLIVLGLPRGGVPVAAEVARSLGAPLDVFVVRKLGFPGQEELAMGALASGGVRVLNPGVIGEGRVSQLEIDAATARESAELARRERAYRDDRPPLDLGGRAVVLVDDGLATGTTMQAALEALRAAGAARIVVAVPVAPADACRALAPLADEVICAATPEPFYAVGAWYDDFSQTTDDEVRALLRASRDRAANQRASGTSS